MKPLFVECSFPGRRYGSGSITNHAVNLSLCTSIQKSRVNWYPDNDGIPSIKFKGCDMEWVFNSDGQRDAELNRLLTFTASPEQSP